MIAIETGFLEGLLRNSWQAAVLVGIVLGVQAVIGRRLTAFWRHALWWVVVVRLLVPAVGESRYSVFAPFVSSGPAEPPTAEVAADFTEGFSSVRREGRSATARESEPGATTAGESPRGGPSPSASWTSSVAPLAPIDGHRLGSQVSIGEAGSVAPRGSDPGARGGDERGGIDPVSVAGWIWIAGVCALSLRVVVQNVRFSVRLRSFGFPAGTRVRALFDECRDRMRVRGRVRLIRCSWLPSPAVYGLWRPVLLLPSRLEDEFSPEALRHVFLHELAHLRRRDLVANVVVEVAGILHWFNPAVWLARVRMRHDRELAADALALAAVSEGEARAYGRTILRVLEGWEKPAGPWTTVGILGDPRQIEGRVRAIAAFRRPGPGSRFGGLVLAGLMVVAMTDKADDDRGASGPSVLLEARWVGWKSLAGRNDTGRLPEILGLPETVRLKAALVGRLAEKAAAGAGIPETSVAAWKRAMEAALDHESVLEVFGSRSGATGWAVGIRVGDAERRDLRETWSRWTSGTAEGPSRVASRDMPGWWVVGVGVGATEAVARRVRMIGTGDLLDPGAVWEGRGDLARVMASLDSTWKPPGPMAEWPRVRWRTGVSGGVLETRATLTYERVMDGELPAWQVPTNWVRDPLVAFAARRGSGAWSERWEGRATPKPGVRPDQVFEWSLAGPPWLRYFAARMDDPRGWLAGRSDAEVVAWFGAFGVPARHAEVRRAPDGGALTLAGLPYLQPQLVGGTAGGRPMLAGGLFPLPRNGDPAPQALIGQLNDRPDLVAYAWETTGQMVSADSADAVRAPNGKRTQTIGRLVQLKELEQYRRLMERREGWKSALGAEGRVLVPGGDWIDAVSGL